MAKPADPIHAIRASELIPTGSRVLAMLSGGVDSICLTAALVELLGVESVAALHVNHGLRNAAPADQAFCEQVGSSLGIGVHCVGVEIPRDAGNIEGLARDARYETAESVRDQLGFDLIATGHTASDQIETLVYRLASSPGRRSLLGIAEQRGRVIRPLLGVDRAATEAFCRGRGIEWREDETNRDTTLARNLIRHRVLPDLRAVHPAADDNMLATAAELRDEALLLEAAVDDALARSGAGTNPPAIEAARLARLEPPLRRLVLRRLAGLAAGGSVALGDADAKQLERLALRPGSSYLDLPGGVRAACEYGVIRFSRDSSSEPAAAVPLTIPGRARFGTWQLVCELGLRAGQSLPESADEALLDADLVGGRLEVRGWRDGDRISPLGLGGSKSLQDLFTDRKVPRALRQSLPVVTAGERIVWVAGVATSDLFKVTADTNRVVRLRARSTT